MRHAPWHCPIIDYMESIAIRTLWHGVMRAILRALNHWYAPQSKLWTPISGASSGESDCSLREQFSYIQAPRRPKLRQERRLIAITLLNCSIVEEAFQLSLSGAACRLAIQPLILYEDTFQIFTPAQMDSLRRGGAILCDCLQHAAGLVRPGAKTIDLDRAAEKFIRDRGGKPAFKGYRGFPASLCVSVNDENVHCIPGPRVLKEGDIVSLDGGVIFEDLYTDACITVPVGVVAADVRVFLNVDAEILEQVIAQVVRPGARVGDISAFIQRELEKHAYHPVRALTGHGLGTTLHQFPDVPNWGKAGTGPILPAHTMIAIEPIATFGSPEVTTDQDQWTIRTKDGSLSCHFEHSVLVTETGAEIIA